MKNEIIYRILKVFMTMLGFVPRRPGKFLGDILGLIWFRVDRRHREITLENIRLSLGRTSHVQDMAIQGKSLKVSSEKNLVLSDIDQQMLAKNIFKNIAGMLFELGWGYLLKREEIPRYFTIKGVENIEKAHARGKGVLVIICHMGNWELLAAAVATTGYKTSILYRKFDFAPLERLILEMRQKYGTVLIPLRGASLQIEQRLSAGEVVGTLMDQNVDWYKGVFVEFFGRPACTNSGVASLVLRTRTAVVPAYIVREGFKHVMHFEPEIPLVSTGDRIKDIEINTQNYTSAIESIIRCYPDQWFWVHNRWKVKNYSVLPQASVLSQGK
ncbi:MAG: lysophospholipid acyltransferase family protein [Desulfamplus sp.]|nr:lysophospholipid acyltransferase family protein [Desulfamplus sp.]